MKSNKSQSNFANAGRRWIDGNQAVAVGGIWQRVGGRSQRVPRRRDHLIARKSTLRFGRCFWNGHICAGVKQDRTESRFLNRHYQTKIGLMSWIVQRLISGASRQNRTKRLRFRTP